MKTIAIVVTLMVLVTFVPTSVSAAPTDYTGEVSLSISDDIYTEEISLSITEDIVGWIKQVGQSIVNMLTAPFNAISDFFGAWGRAIIEDTPWIAPIVVTISIMGSWLVYKGFSYFQSVWFD